jgi:hypothetical protein
VLSTRSRANDEGKPESRHREDQSQP